MLVKITRYGEGWLNPAQIVELNKLTGYTTTFVADNPENPRENLWEITGENILETFKLLNPVEFSGNWEQYVNEAKINHLWLAAKSYQEAQLDSNGFAAILVKATIQQTPKAVAIVAWVNAIWADYQTRKQAILDWVTPEPVLNELGMNIAPSLVVDYKFSGNGNMPHSFYDAINEAQQ